MMQRILNIMNYMEEQGDLFEVNRNEYVLAHCVSADVSADRGMGAGIAKVFRKKYPNMPKDIQHDIEIGRAIRYEKDGDVIYNLITKPLVQVKVYHDSKRYYKNLRSSLGDLRAQMYANGEEKLAMPRIACGLDGGDWKIVSNIIKDVFEETEIEIVIRILEKDVNDDDDIHSQGY